jgi:uncharacterized protein with beta-barrel porin domain
VFDAMVGLGENEVEAALNAISGEAHASVQSVIENTFAQFGEGLTQRAMGGLSAGDAGFSPLGYAARSTSAGVDAIDSAMLNPVPVSAWLAPLGGHASLTGNANAAALDLWSAGLAGGYEITGDNALAGVAFGYQRGWASVAARQSQSTIDSFMLGTYGALRDGPNTLTGALTIGTSHVATSRTITVGNVTNTANADYWTQSIGLSLEAAHDIELGIGTTLSPLATLDLGWSGHGGFTETGAGAFNLTAAAMGAIQIDAGLGLGISHVIATEGGTLTLSGRAVWEHGVIGGNTGQSMTFAGGTTPFTVTGASPDGDRLKLGAGLTYKANDGLSFGASYTGSFSASGSAHKASVAINVQF